MKKVLSMALMLMMILSLFAVPTMAATMAIENIYDGGFEIAGTGYDLTTTQSTTVFGGSGATAGHADSKVVLKDGDNALQLASTGTAAEYRSTQFAQKAGTAYVLSFDVYTEVEMNSERMIQLNNYGTTYASEQVLGAATTDGITLSKGGSALYINSIPQEMWAHVEISLIPNSSGTNNSISIILNAKEATNTIIGYIDNVSFKHQEDAWALAVTEVNDYGTVSEVPEVIGKTQTVPVTVTPNEGYYLHSATLNGTDITADFTEVYEAADIEVPYYTYTLDASSLSADATLAITYGKYEKTNVMTGAFDTPGSGGATLGTSGTYTNGGAFSYELTKTSEEANISLRNYITGITADDLLLAKWDVYVPSGNGATGAIYAAANTSNRINVITANSWWGAKPNAPTAGTWKSYATYSKAKIDVESTSVEFKTTVTPDANGNLAVYYDNISVVKLTKAGVPIPEVYDVTITAGANANASVSAATSEGEAINFTVAPKFGYYIESITIGGEDFLGFDAYKGGTYSTGAIEADTEIVVTVAELSANTAEGVSTAVATLPAVFAEAGEAPVTFGKVLADVATVDEFGIYLTKDGDGVTSAKTEMGPHFKAFYNVNGQYAIEFQGLEAGEYVAKTYVKVAGEITYGIATTFTVE